MQLYVGPCHVVSAEIAVAMAVPIENPADCEVRGVISFLQADVILGYLAEEASSCMELFCCMSTYCPADASLEDEKFHWDIFEHPPYSSDLAPSDFFLCVCACLNVKEDYVEMWISRQRYVPKLVYSVSVLLLKNILLW